MLCARNIRPDPDKEHSVAVSPADFPPSRDGHDIYILVNGNYVLSARPTETCRPGEIGLTDRQRTWAGVSLGPHDIVVVQNYDHFGEGGGAYLASVDVEVGFAGRKTTEVPYDQDELGQFFTRNFENQILAPGQQLLMDHKNIPLTLVIRAVRLADLTMEKANTDTPPISDPRARGILTRQTQVDFFKSAQSELKLKGSSRRPAANSIVQPGFKFEDMGIGGLDEEFSAIFRRAFASRIFPPGLVDKLGIQHIRGILLHGPPGTGKTLIARQIGKMLNAREPKVINGPEVLNKFVGQSEENIRKLFADAEKEQKEKGDESELHIIIFDELDAVCKQRGSGAGGGTGVGDSVVNQLLSKLDGVEQLNNILLIGMTNRMDMIDEALLRPGRLELHMEISLPDEHGRQQILNIHTSKMRNNGVLEDDVDVAELAKLTKNYSGAEITGLVKAASSFAFSRHIKVGTMATVQDDVVNMKVKRVDFLNALEEVRPLFGVAEEELEKCIRGGIIHFSPTINSILDEGNLYINQVRKGGSPLLSVVLHGPPGSGKTALAAELAMKSEFPFIKLISPEDMVGYGEMQKVQLLDKTFRDAYKSPMSVVVIDNIELLVDWVPIGPRFSNTVLVALKVLLGKQPPKVRDARGIFICCVCIADGRITGPAAAHSRHDDRAVGAAAARPVQPVRRRDPGAERQQPARAGVHLGGVACVPEQRPGSERGQRDPVHDWQLRGRGRNQEDSDGHRDGQAGPAGHGRTVRSGHVAGHCRTLVCMNGDRRWDGKGSNARHACCRAVGIEDTQDQWMAALANAVQRCTGYRIDHAMLTWACFDRLAAGRTALLLGLDLSAGQHASLAG